MASPLDKILGRRVNGVRVVPLVIKIVVIFTVFLLISNFASNYINLVLNRGEQVRLLSQLLEKDLKTLHVFANNQHEIYNFDQNLEDAVSQIEGAGVRDLPGERSIAIGVKPNGDLFFQGLKIPRQNEFTDAEALGRMNSNREEGVQEAAIEFNFAGQTYFGMYKYNTNWDTYIVRAEEQNEFYSDSRRIFTEVALLIVLITVVCIVVGVFLIRFILRFVGIMTGAIMQMQQNQSIELLDMEGAPNDDVTYMGVAFNSLSATISNLMEIFKKFVARDTAQEAYRSGRIELTGDRKDLTILFSDIKSFTYMTETLGTDIIKLLNMHYDKAIHHIHEHHGDIGSIIGDALLAIYGHMEEYDVNKSYQAIRSAYHIHEVAASLRKEFNDIREDLIKRRGALTEAEERVYKAVLIEVGVGIDGGDVFYGNIGSYERMVNTVIGDNVNSASRLEGLTRVYKCPVIVSEYVREDVEKEYDEYVFMELDTVQVKGKTIGRQVYWPIPKSQIDDELQSDIDLYTKGLKDYYEGNWERAHDLFTRCTLAAAEVFRERTESKKAPQDWKGIWAMTEK